MSALGDAPWVEADDRATWRDWLEANHATANGAWLVTWRPRSGKAGLDYEAAIEEALCFGWVDSTAGRVDDERGRLYFAPRKARSGWAATNKARVERLVAAGQMAPAGLAAIERAKANGSWEVLDSVERLEVPADLDAALDGGPPAAAANFSAFPPGARKQMLAWVAFAQRPETRAARIAQIVESAARNVRARELTTARPAADDGPAPWPPARSRTPPSSVTQGQQMGVVGPLRPAARVRRTLSLSCRHRRARYDRRPGVYRRERPGVLTRCHVNDDAPAGPERGRPSTP